MPASLHLVARATAETPHPLYFDLLDDGDARVLELFEAQRQTPLIDLSLAERDVPEVIAALHWAEEVHVHAIHPDLVLRVLPAVREDSLRHTTLVFHGTWPPLPGTVRDLHIARLKHWPGPARHDGRGRVEDIRARVLGSIHQSPPVEVLDRHRADLLPRATSASPIPLDDGRFLATVVLAGCLDESLRSALLQAIPSVGRAEVIVQACDESLIPLAERAEFRRTAQAYVTRARFSTELLEATMQEIPIIVLDDAHTAELNPDDLPLDAVRLGGRGQVADRVVSCIRSWTSLWATGRSGPVEAASRRPFADRCLASPSTSSATPTAFRSS